MRNLNRILLNVVLALCLTSCTYCRDSENFGYPRKVSFLVNGGSTTISGDLSVPGFQIQDKDGVAEGSIDDWTNANDTLRCTYQWLTAKCKAGSTQIELTAEPNMTKKERKLWIELTMGYDYAQVEVIQAAK